MGEGAAAGGIGDLAENAVLLLVQGVDDVEQQGGAPRGNQAEIGALREQGGGADLPAFGALLFGKPGVVERLRGDVFGERAAEVVEVVACADGDAACGVAAAAGGGADDEVKAARKGVGALGD